MWTGPVPVPAIDLYAEYMVLHNTEMSRGDDSKQPGPSLIEACRRYGVAGMDKAYKDDMRSLAYTKTNHTPEEIALLQDYCLDRQPNGDAAVQCDAAAHRSITRADPRRLHDGDRAHALARHSDRYADLPPGGAARARWSYRRCAKSSTVNWEPRSTFRTCSSARPCFR